ncbi:MAG: DUF6159 family protein [Halovenus sp.]
MRLIERFKTAVTLIKHSVGVMRSHPRLALFPVLSGLFGLAFLALVMTPMLGVLSLDAGTTTTQVVGVAVIGALYLGTAFITSFFTAALVHQTRAVLGGEEPGLREGIDGAWAVKGPLFVWAFISATVGLVLDAISESDSMVGQILSTIFGIAWTLMTFFVIPVIVFEQPSIREMFERSAGLFKDTFGETPISLAGVSLVGLIAALPALGPGAYLLFVAGQPLLGIPLFVVGVLIAQLLSSTLRGIVKTSLYFYATEEQRPDEFDGIFDRLDESRSSTPSGVTGGGFQ